MLHPLEKCPSATALNSIPRGLTISIAWTLSVKRCNSYSSFRILLHGMNQTECLSNDVISSIFLTAILIYAVISDKRPNVAAAAARCQHPLHNIVAAAVRFQLNDERQCLALVEHVKTNVELRYRWLVIESPRLFEILSQVFICD